MNEKLPQRTEKPWGYEILFAHTPLYAGKIIFIRQGHRFSLQYHKKKDESFYIYQGKALLEMDGQDGKPEESIVQAGDCFRVQPMTKHRLKAIEDTTLLEASTPELEDVVRLQDDYGR